MKPLAPSDNCFCNRYSVGIIIKRICRKVCLCESTLTVIILTCIYSVNTDRIQDVGGGNSTLIESDNQREDNFSDTPLDTAGKCKYSV